MQKRVPIWKKTSSVREIRTEIRKFRKEELAVASALLVLVSFTLKEAVNESLKDKRESIENVVAQLEKDAIRKEESQGSRDLGEKIDRSIAAHFADMNGAISAGSTEHRRAALRQDMDREISELEFGTLNTLKFTDAAIDKLHDGKAYKAELEDLHRDLKKHMDSDDREIGQSRNENDNDMAMQMDLTDLQRISGDTFFLRGRVWADLLIMKNRLERWGSIAKWGTYAVFIIGWTLGLVLSLKGKKPESISE